MREIVMEPDETGVFVPVKGRDTVTSRVAKRKAPRRTTIREFDIADTVARGAVMGLMTFALIAMSPHIATLKKYFDGESDLKHFQVSPLNIDHPALFSSIRL